MAHIGPDLPGLPLSLNSNQYKSLVSYCFFAAYTGSCLFLHKCHMSLWMSEYPIHAPASKKIRMSIFMSKIKFMLDGSNDDQKL